MYGRRRENVSHYNVFIYFSSKQTVSCNSLILFIAKTPIYLKMDDQVETSSRDRSRSRDRSADDERRRDVEKKEDEEQGDVNNLYVTNLSLKVCSNQLQLIMI